MQSTDAAVARTGRRARAHSQTRDRLPEIARPTCFLGDPSRRCMFGCVTSLPTLSASSTRIIGNDVTTPRRASSCSSSSSIGGGNIQRRLGANRLAASNKVKLGRRRRRVVDSGQETARAALRRARESFGTPHPPIADAVQNPRVGANYVKGHVVFLILPVDEPLLDVFIGV